MWQFPSNIFFAITNVQLTTLLDDNQTKTIILSAYDRKGQICIEILQLKGLCAKLRYFMGRRTGPPRVRKQYFACDLDPFNGRNKHLPVIFPRQLQHPWRKVQLPYVYNSVRTCTIASVRVQQRPYVYNSVRTCTIASVCVQQRPCVYNDDHVLNLVVYFQRLQIQEIGFRFQNIMYQQWTFL